MRNAFFSFIFFCLAILCGCIPKNAGEVTLVNSGIKEAKIAIDQRSFSIGASHHITKPIAEGIHRVTIDSSKPYEINVVRDKTTIFDSTGLSCFAVVDFAEAYRGGEIKIVEKSFRERTFLTSSKMSLVLGEHLPKSIKPHEKLLQAVQIDCEIFNDDKAIIAENQPKK